MVAKNPSNRLPFRASGASRRNPKIRRDEIEILDLLYCRFREFNNLVEVEGGKFCTDSSLG